MLREERVNYAVYAANGTNIACMKRALHAAARHSIVDNIVDADISSFIGKRQRYASSDAFPRTRNQSFFTVEQSHPRPPESPLAGDSDLCRHRS